MALIIDIRHNGEKLLILDDHNHILIHFSDEGNDNLEGFALTQDEFILAIQTAIKSRTTYPKFLDHMDEEKKSEK